MNPEKIISSEHLLELLTAEGIDRFTYQKAELLQIAICDYPGPVQEPIDFLKILEQEIAKPLTIENIRAFQSKLNVKVDAWKAESLAVVIILLEESKHLTL